MSKVLGENVTFRIEVEDKPLGILLVLDRKCDVAFVPWEDAFRLSEVMTQVANDVKTEFVPCLDFIKIEQEQAQIRLNHHKGLVAICVEWTDRLRFTTLEAWGLVTIALRKCAQDAQLELDGVGFTYDNQGNIRKMHNHKLGTTTKIR